MVQWYIHNQICHDHSCGVWLASTEGSKYTQLPMALSFIDPDNQTEFRTWRTWFTGIWSDSTWWKVEKVNSGRGRTNLMQFNHKEHISKVIILCRVARPCFNTSTNLWCWVWLKVGHWLTREWWPEQQTSSNQPGEPLCGRILWWQKKCIVACKETHQISFILEKLPPTSRKIRIQQDGA